MYILRYIVEGIEGEAKRCVHGSFMSCRKYTFKCYLKAKRAFFFFFLLRLLLTYASSSRKLMITTLYNSNNVFRMK